MPEAHVGCLLLRNEQTKSLDRLKNLIARSSRPVLDQSLLRIGLYPPSSVPLSTDRVCPRSMSLIPMGRLYFILVVHSPHAQVAADGASATTGASGSPLADTAQAQTQTQAETQRPPKEANPPSGKEPAAKPSQGSGRPLQPKPRPKPKEPKSRSPGSQIPKGRDPHPSHRQESLARISGLQPDAPLRGLARQGILRKGTTIHLNIGACDINALLVILFIIHAQPQRLPRQLDVQTLANVALIAEFYQCGIVRSFSGGWHDAVKDYKLPDRYCPDLLQLLWDSYYFRWTGCFNAYSMSFPGFPIPEQIVGM